MALTCKWAIIHIDDGRSKVLKILVTGVAGFIGMHVAADWSSAVTLLELIISATIMRVN